MPENNTPVHITLKQPCGLNAMQRGRLKKVMSKIYKFSDGSTQELRDYIRSHTWTHKTHTVREYSRKGIDLKYKKLKNPIHIYTIWNGDIGLDVPKTFYDLIDNLEEK